MTGYEWLLILIISALLIGWGLRSFSRRKKKISKTDLSDVFLGVARLDDREIHGMTQDDFRAGHVCGQCWLHVGNGDEYEHAVLVTHGVKMKSNRESKPET